MYSDNHKSANDYPEDIDFYIKAELEMGSLKGPFDSPPFEFSHLAPLMSRIKDQGSKRRIISDLKFPQEISINSYIPSNVYMGSERQHTLPKADDVVSYINTEFKDYWLCTTDLKNAYKHFNCCPSDYPLFTIKWRGRYYFESSIPFGARMSSFLMQSVANAIIDILKKKNIKGYMYLDDLLIISKTKEKVKEIKRRYINCSKN